MTLKTLIPMLNVADIEASLEFYRDALGFEVVSLPDKVKEWQWATIRSGATELMVSQTEEGPQLAMPIDLAANSGWPTIFYFYPDDVVALYESVRAKGFETTELETTFYGMREFSMQDPDGHVLSFGQDVEE